MSEGFQPTFRNGIVVFDDIFTERVFVVAASVVSASIKPSTDPNDIQLELRLLGNHILTYRVKNRVDAMDIVRLIFIDFASEKKN